MSQRLWDEILGLQPHCSRLGCKVKPISFQISCCGRKPATSNQVCAIRWRDGRVRGLIAAILRQGRGPRDFPVHTILPSFRTQEELGYEAELKHVQRNVCVS